MSLRHRDLLATAIAAALCAAVVLFVPITAIRAVFATPLCLILPGYAVTVACFAERKLGGAHLLMLSVAMSLATLAIGAVVLNLLPGGLRSGWWVGLIMVIVLVGCGVAALRRPRSAQSRPRDRLPRVRRADAAMLLGACAAVAATFTLSHTQLPARHVVGYTQLWMLPAGDSGTTAAVRVGVASAQLHPLAYRLELRLGSRRVVMSLRFALKPGQEYEKLVPVASPATGRSTEITALLYQDDRATAVYRRVTGWLPPVPQEGRAVPRRFGNGHDLAARAAIVARGEQIAATFKSSVIALLSKP